MREPNNVDDGGRLLVSRPPPFQGEKEQIGVLKMGTSRLMKPLFCGGMFNREGRRMRAVFVRSVSSGRQTYRAVNPMKVCIFYGRTFSTLGNKISEGQIRFL